MDGSGRNFLGRFLEGKASPSSFLVTIASRVWRLLSKNAVNGGFLLRFSKSCQVLATKKLCNLQLRLTSVQRDVTSFMPGVGVAGNRSGKRVGGNGH